MRIDTLVEDVARHYSACLDNKNEVSRGENSPSN